MAFRALLKWLCPWRAEDRGILTRSSLLISSSPRWLSAGGSTRVPSAGPGGKALRKKVPTCLGVRKTRLCSLPWFRSLASCLPQFPLLSNEWSGPCDQAIYDEWAECELWGASWSRWAASGWVLSISRSFNNKLQYVTSGSHSVSVSLNLSPFRGLSHTYFEELGVVNEVMCVKSQVQSLGHGRL